MIMFRRHLLVLAALLAGVGLWAMPKPAIALDINFYPVGECPNNHPLEYTLIEGADISQDDAATNLSRIVDAMVDIYKTPEQSGTIYFRTRANGVAAVYCINRSLRVLPYVNMIGIKHNGEPLTASGKITIKNNYVSIPDHDMEFSRGPVLFGGYDGPDVAANPYIADDTSGNVTFRRIVKHEGLWPGEGGPEIAKNRIRVWQEDLKSVKLGDEIQILSCTNSTEINDDKTKVRPDYMFKTIVVATTTSNGNWLILKHDIPFAFTNETDLTKTHYQWGLNNNPDPDNNPDTPNPFPPIPKGQPCWFRVAEWYSPQPSYWSDPNDPNNGYHKYLELGTDDNPSKWTRGWTTHDCTFKHITFQSVSANVTAGAGPFDSHFEDCSFIGKKCLYYNACQNTEFTKINCIFWDQVAEFSYNSWKCTLNDVTATYTDAIGTKPAWGVLSKGALFALKENTRDFKIDKFTLKAFYKDSNNVEIERPTAGLNSSMIRVQGSYNIFGENDVIELHAPLVNTYLEIIPQNDDAEPPAGVKFLNTRVYMRSHAPDSNLINISGGVQDVTVKNTKFFGYPSSPAPSCNWKISSTSNVSTFTLGPDLVIPGQLDVDGEVDGTNTIHYTGSKFNGYTYPDIETQGITGYYSGCFGWEP